MSCGIGLKILQWSVLLNQTIAIDKYYGYVWEYRHFFLANMLTNRIKIT